MSVEIGKQDIEKFILIGDRILIKPKSPRDRTKSGLFLPPGVHEKEKIHTGYIVKVGPGYPVPAITDYDEPWKDKSDQVKYVPLQCKVGDLAVYLQSNTFEIQFNGQPYVIVPNSAVLLLVRDESLFR